MYAGSQLPSRFPAVTRRRQGRPDASRIQHATETVRLAWHDLPRPNRDLLQNVGAAQHRVVDEPLGGLADALLSSAGEPSMSRSARNDLDQALGAWIPRLRVVLINAGHAALRGLDAPSYEAMLARTAWHEWGHALSLSRATSDDIAGGERLLGLAPEGVAEFIRSSGYRRNEYTHELVAETYALLMARRRRGQIGQPAWLVDEIYALVRRVTGWTP